MTAAFEVKLPRRGHLFRSGCAQSRCFFTAFERQARRATSPQACHLNLCKIILRCRRVCYRVQRLLPVLLPENSHKYTAICLVAAKERTQHTTRHADAPKFTFKTYFFEEDELGPSFKYPVNETYKDVRDTLQKSSIESSRLAST